MTIKELLIAARNKITPPGAWTQHVAARDKDGRPIDARSEAAVCWCASGALASFDRSATLHYAASDCLTSAVGELYVSYNDRMDHAAVLDMFDKAIDAS